MSSFKINQVALQLYTLRDSCQTLPDFVTTLEKVRKIGYKAVQISGVNVPYVEAKKALDDAGMIVCATHEPSEQILDNPESICERLKLIGTTKTAYPWPAGIDFNNEKVVREFARKLDAAGAVLAKNGYTLSYHHHSLEFVRFGKATVLDYIFEASNPANLKAEIDTYWIQCGGGDPATWIERMKGRVPVIHFKDFVYVKDAMPAFGEVGYGNLDWDRIIAAAERAGTEWLVVEQDVCPGDPFVSIQKSYDYLKAKLGS